MNVPIARNVPLSPMTTLGVGGNADYFARVRTETELTEVIHWAQKEKLPITVLGGGSNVLVSDRGVAGLVLVPQIEDKAVRHEGDTTYVTVGAGLVLDTTVLECVGEGLWGIENLSGIPGTIGGVPIQNVGAYGVEAKDVIHSVQVYDIDAGASQVLTCAECGFGYRTSLFKKREGRKYIITHVTFKLTKVRTPHLSYRDLTAYFEGTNDPTLEQIRDAVLTIRSRKFPDWHEMGTAGSFFKNPIVDADTCAKLRAQYPELPTYETENGYYKIALGWILDKALHLRGYREGNVGLYSEQALVLVNYGGATSSEIQIFSEHIIEKIHASTGLTVEREVVIVS